MTPQLDLLNSLAHKVDTTPRLTRDETLSILRSCYALGLTPLSQVVTETMLAKITATRRKEGANRAFVLKSRQTPYTLIVRYVFSSEKERTNASRYTTVLTYLAAQNIDPEHFGQEVASRGGLSAIYWKARDRTSKLLSRNKLQLATTITVITEKPVILKLLPHANGVFDVLDCSQLE